MAKWCTLASMPDGVEAAQGVAINLDHLDLIEWSYDAQKALFQVVLALPQSLGNANLSGGDFWSVDERHILMQDDRAFDVTEYVYAHQHSRGISPIPGLRRHCDNAWSEKDAAYRTREREAELALTTS